jgi:hypothetical protein
MSVDIFIVCIYWPEPLRGQTEQSGPHALPIEQQHVPLEYLPTTGRLQDSLWYSK